MSRRTRQQIEQKTICPIGVEYKNNRTVEDWKEKYCYMRKQMQQQIPDFSVKAKDNTWLSNLVWKLLNWLVSWIWREEPPNLLKGPTTVMRTLWTGSDWENLSYRNRWLTLCHEKHYLLLLWGKHDWRFPRWHYVAHLLKMFWNREYRQEVLEICWQVNIDYHIQNSGGILNQHLKHQIIRALSGPDYCFSFTKSEATDCVERMIEKSFTSLKKETNDG